MKLELSSDEASMVVGMCIASRYSTAMYSSEREILDRIINKIFAEDKKTVEGYKK